MAPRRPKNKNDLPVVAKPLGEVLALTDEEIAEREIACAARLFLAGEDPVAVHLLASAAWDVCERHLGPEDSIMETFLRQSVAPEYRNGTRTVLKEPYNQLKHGSGPGSATHSFMPELLPLYMMLAATSFRLAFGRTPASMDQLRAIAQANDLQFPPATP